MSVNIKQNGSLVKISGSSSWTGTRAEYEAVKDNIPVGSMVNITDDEDYIPENGGGSGDSNIIINPPDIISSDELATGIKVNDTNYIISPGRYEQNNIDIHTGELTTGLYEGLQLDANNMKASSGTATTSYTATEDSYILVYANVQNVNNTSYITGSTNLNVVSSNPDGIVKYYDSEDTQIDWSTYRIIIYKIYEGTEITVSAASAKSYNTSSVAIINIEYDTVLEILDTSEGANKQTVTRTYTSPKPQYIICTIISYDSISKFNIYKNNIQLTSDDMSSYDSKDNIAFGIIALNSGDKLTVEYASGAGSYSRIVGLICSLDLNEVIDTVKLPIEKEYFKKQLVDNVVFQTNEMPIASIDNVGLTILYTGENTTEFSHGSHYKNIETDSVYSWEEVTSSGGGGTGLPDPTIADVILKSNDDLEWEEYDINNKQDIIPTYTSSEYEAIKDTIPTGTLFNISDDNPVNPLADVSWKNITSECTWNTTTIRSDSGLNLVFENKALRMYMVQAYFNKTTGIGLDVVTLPNVAIASFKSGTTTYNSPSSSFAEISINSGTNRVYVDISHAGNNMPVQLFVLY